ncbi:hypothetical protein A0K93_03465 [Corynebacterium sp. BCW_4722]|nr:hypothetical protein A0K93_03465 [Corynebacterium sp. BCW_4722]
MQNDGIRDRKRRETKRRIIDEAVRLVQESGFDAVTVEDICAAAGISRRTFFNYMDSKDEAVLGVFPFVFSAESLERIRTTPSGNMLELIIASVDTVDEAYGPTPEIRHALLEANPELLHAEAARKRHMLIELGTALNDHFQRFPGDLRAGSEAKRETHIVLGLFRTALSRYLWSPAASGCADPVEGLRRTAQDITTYAQELKW